MDKKLMQAFGSLFTLIAEDEKDFKATEQASVKIGEFINENGYGGPEILRLLVNVIATHIDAKDKAMIMGFTSIARLFEEDPFFKEVKTLIGS
jgi:hypothetical protein